MSRNTRGFLTGLGIGAGVIGLAAGTAGALALAHKKAKEHDQTTMEYIKGKARKVLPKKNICHCDECDDECFFCDDEFDDDQLSIDDAASLFDRDDEDVEEEITLLDRVTMERDDYKQKYEELLKLLSSNTENEVNE